MSDHRLEWFSFILFNSYSMQWSMGAIYVRVVGQGWRNEY